MAKFSIITHFVVVVFDAILSAAIKVLLINLTLKTFLAVIVQELERYRRNMSTGVKKSRSAVNATLA